MPKTTRDLIHEICDNLADGLPVSKADRELLRKLALAGLEAKEDAERLDWLERNPSQVRFATGYHGSASNWTYQREGFTHDAPSLRFAIDAARKEKP